MSCSQLLLIVPHSGCVFRLKVAFAHSSEYLDKHLMLSVHENETTFVYQDELQQHIQLTARL